MIPLEDQIKNKITELKTLATADMAEAAKLADKATNQKQLAAELQDILDRAKPSPMSMSLERRPDLDADIQFLLLRSMKAGSTTMGGEPRDVGMSSNSIVGIAYGLLTLEEQTLPLDRSDLHSCKIMWEKMPAHRKSGPARKAMEKAAKHLNDI